MATQSSAQKAKSLGRSRTESPPVEWTAGRERDEIYGLLSVMYHALKGAETYSTYVRDAERADDEQLADFFEKCCDEETERADHAKRLLADRIGGSYDDDAGGDGDDAGETD